MVGGEMDFHALARRDLQALCKKNQIPANLTSVAMADALASLPLVEGLEEFLHPTEDDVMQSPEKEKPLMQVLTRSMTRASTRRRTALEPESEQLPSRATACRSMRNRNAAVADQESKVLNFHETLAVSRTKKRAEAALVQPKAEKEEEESEKNDEGDVVAERTAVKSVVKTRREKTRASVTQPTRVYTRRSTRLLEKSMNDLKLCSEVIRDLEPIKMGDLAAEKDLTEEPEDAIKDENVSESVQTVVEENPMENKDEIKTLPPAEVVACDVEALVEAESEIEVEEESKSNEICHKSEIQVTESEVDASIGVESSESNLPCSQLIANVQDKESNKFDNETWAAEDLSDFSHISERTESYSGEIYINSEAVTQEVEVVIGLGNEMGTEKASRSSQSKIQESQVIANDKSDELDELSAGAPQEGLTSVEEAAAEYGYAELEGNVAITDGGNVSELTAQVASLNLSYPKDTNEDMDSQVIITAAAHDVSACFVKESKMGHYEDDTIVFDGYLTEDDGGKNGDGISDKLDIHDAALSEKPNDAVPNSAEEIESCHNVGQLHDVNASEAEEFVTKIGHWNEKSVETVDVRVISGAEFVDGAYKTMENVDLEAQNNEIQVGAGGSESEPQEVFSKKTPASIKKMNRIPPSPLAVGRPDELPTPLNSSSKKMQLEDVNKENRGDGSEVGKENITDLLIAEDDNQKPTPLEKKSFRQLKKMLKEKTMMQNEKRLALQMLPENPMAVVGEKDD